MKSTNILVLYYFRQLCYDFVLVLNVNDTYIIEIFFEYIFITREHRSSIRDYTNSAKCCNYFNMFFFFFLGEDFSRRLCVAMHRLFRSSERCANDRGD